MRRYILNRRKGKLFYAFLSLLIAFIVLPVAAALTMSLGALRSAGADSRRNFNAALEAQIQYSQSISLGRAHAAYLRELKKEVRFFEELGRRVEPGRDGGFLRAKDMLRSLETVGPPEKTKWFLYFSKSDYLMGTDQSAIDARSYAPPHILASIAGVDPQDTKYSRNRYGTNSAGEYHTTYAGVVAPNVFFIYDREYGPGGLGSTLLSKDLTADLSELEMAHYDSYGSWLPITRNQSMIPLYTYDTLAGSSGSFSFRRGGAGYLCYYFQNTDNLTKFALYCRDTVGEAYRSATLLLLIGAACVLSIGFAFAMIFLKRAYSPLEALISRLPQSDDGKALRDDYRVLSDALDSMDSKIEKQRELLSRSYLLRVLKGQTTEANEEPPREWFTGGGRGAYAAAAVAIDAAADSAEQRENLLESSLREYFRKAGYEILTAWDGGFLLAAIGLGRRDISALAADFGRYQGNLKKWSVSVYLSAAHQTTRELRRCCGEAMTAADFCLRLEKYGTVQRYDEIRDAERGKAAASPDFMSLQKLSDSIAALRPRDSLDQFDNIVLQFSERLGRALTQEDMAFSVLSNTVALAFYDISLPGDISKTAIQSYVEQLRAAKTISRLRGLLKSSLEEFDDMNTVRTSDQKRFEQIKAFILENFRDPNLYSASVADHFGTSPPNITRMFKKYNRTGFLEYVHQLRVAEALKLLEETDLAAAAIASRVGYANSITMLRAFKTYAHSTPGLIRKLQK